MSLLMQACEMPRRRASPSQSLVLQGQEATACKPDDPRSEPGAELAAEQVGAEKDRRRKSSDLRDDAVGAEEKAGGHMSPQRRKCEP